MNSPLTEAVQLSWKLLGECLAGSTLQIWHLVKAYIPLLKIQPLRPLKHCSKALDTRYVHYLSTLQFLRSLTPRQEPNNVKPATRSPSPLYEIDETSSPELTEVATIRQRSFSVSDSPLCIDIPKRFSLGGGGKVGRRLSTSALDPEEKAMRAAMAEGLSKGDKRRMQNKLAQRAFRARNKVVNKQVSHTLSLLDCLALQFSSGTRPD